MKQKLGFQIDVVIPTYKPDGKLDRLMKQLSRQTYPIRKVIIMNTGTVLEGEETYRQWLEAFGNTTLEVHHLPPVEFDHGGTRNAGAGYSDADLCLFMTQDAVPADAYLVEKLVAPFRIEEVGIVYARQLPTEDCRPVERFTRSFNYPEKSRKKTEEDLGTLGIKTFFASNVCAAYRMSMFRELGGFERKTIFNEDMIFAGNMIQKGWAIVYMAEAKVVHSHNYSNAEQFHRNFDLAVSQKQHPEVFAGVRSESEGIRLVKKTAAHLIKEKKPWLIPGMIITSGCKYMGYLLGKNYDKLPMGLVRKLSWNKRYWT